MLCMIPYKIFMVDNSSFIGVKVSYHFRKIFQNSDTTGQETSNIYIYISLQKLGIFYCYFNLVGLRHRSLDAGHCFTFWKVTVTLNLANPRPKTNFNQ